MLRDGGYIYPCERSRKEIQQAALHAPYDEDSPIYPKHYRRPSNDALAWDHPKGMNWRFRVPDGEPITFIDQRLGLQCYVAGDDFGDFLIWNRDDIPAYELAVVVDDAAMHISEVVRGKDLLKSTTRQLLVYRALGYKPPQFYHTQLVLDENGIRLARRSNAFSLRAFRERGWTPEAVKALIVDSLEA